MVQCSLTLCCNDVLHSSSKGKSPTETINPALWLLQFLATFVNVKTLGINMFC